MLMSVRTTSPITNQIKDTRSVVKALYIYTFATLIDWPEEYRKGNFIISVYGSKQDVYDELNKKYSGKSIGSQEIVIKRFTSTADIGKAHILYITEDKSSQISTLVTKYNKKPTLLVTNKTGHLNKGSVINFVLDGSKQAYEISKPNAKKHNLIIASKLTGLAIKVIE